MEMQQGDQVDTFQEMFQLNSQDSQQIWSDLQTTDFPEKHFDVTRLDDIDLLLDNLFKTSAAPRDIREEHQLQM